MAMAVGVYRLALISRYMYLFTHTILRTAHHTCFIIALTLTVSIFTFILSRVSLMIDTNESPVIELVIYKLMNS